MEKGDFFFLNSIALLFIYLFIWLLRVLVAARGIFTAARGVFLIAACGIFFLIFSRGMRDLVPGPGIKPGRPALGVRSLNRWTTREVPKRGIF